MNVEEMADAKETVISEIPELNKTSSELKINMSNSELTEALNAGNEDNEIGVTCSEENNLTSDLVSQLDAEDKCTEKKLQQKANKLEENVASKSEVFKKPVLLIGPRKGKSAGKIQIYKSSDVPSNSSTKKTEEDDEIEEESDISSDQESTDQNLLNYQDEETNEIKNSVNVSPAVKLKEDSVPLSYKEPKWSGIPTKSYKFEILKNGSIVKTIDLSSKPFYVFGRITTCDIHMAHPTVSRFHAVLQYRIDNTEEPAGFYIYDLGSTHGTFLNKYRIKSNMYVRIHVGHLLKIGGSSRIYILQGPEEDMEQESELTVTELKEKRKKEEQDKECELQRLEEEERLRQEKAEKDGIDWGMGDDADEETDLSENPFATTQNEELYLDDPKKTLRGWFEREGFELEYNVEEKGFAQFLCSVELPMENVKGGVIVAEALVKGKKKESVVQCALEACRILDRYGLLRQANHESRKRKVKNWEENDYYDSDEDSFLDRTGAVEKKREQRMKAAGKAQDQCETYESLLKKHENVTSQINKIQQQITDATHKMKAHKPEDNEDEDALDAFMTSLNSEVTDKKFVNKLKTELVMLRQEEARLRKLVNIARPTSLPELIQFSPSSDGSSSTSSKPFPMIGARRKPSILNKRVQEKPKKSEFSETSMDVEEEEEEEEDEEEEGQNNKIASENKKVETDRELQHTSKKLESDCSERIEHSPSNNERKDSCGSSLNKNKEQEIGKKFKIIGPSLPPPDASFEVPSVEKKKRNRHRKEPHKGNSNYDPTDLKYSMWLPPEDQSGDGRTKLNDKYGY